MTERITWDLIKDQDLFSHEAMESILNCTCGKCREEAKIRLFRHIAMQIYPEYIEQTLYYNNGKHLFIPVGTEWYERDLDDELIEWTYQAKLKALDALRRSNNRRIGQFVRHEIEWRFCNHCGKAVKKWYECQRSGYRYHICDDCRPHYFTQCEYCGKWYDSTSMTWISHEGTEKSICNVCYMERYFRCYNCRSSSLIENGYTYMDRYNIVEGLESGGIHLCAYCADPDSDEWYACDGCGTHYPKFDMESTDDDMYLCSECYERYRIIREWGWKPTPIYKTSKKNPKIMRDKLFYGVELEIEQGSMGCSVPEIAEFILDFWGGENEIYVKQDATINRGLEIVTHPFTWQQFRDTRPKWKEFLKEIRNNGYGADDWNNVGMHVHMSKNAFTRFHLYKFLTFLYANGNRKFVKEIAGRGNNDYALWCSSDQGEGVKYNAKAKYNISEERHAAVNLTGETTIEVRIFASTVYHTKFFKNIEFLNSLFDFTKNTKTQQITVSHYWNYLISKYQCNRYRILQEFIRNNENIKSNYGLFTDNPNQQEDDECV